MCDYLLVNVFINFLDFSLAKRSVFVIGFDLMIVENPFLAVVAIPVFAAVNKIFPSHPKRFCLVE